MGQVLTAAQGQNPARQAAMSAGIAKEAPAWGVNQVCGSGLRAVALGCQAIQAGDAAIVIAGGQESMSESTHAQALRTGTKMGAVELVDTMIKDGLWDAFNGYHMGITAEKRRRTVSDRPRGAGRVRRRQPEQGERRAGRRTVRRRDRAGDDQGAQGRHGRRHRRIYPRRRDGRRSSAASRAQFKKDGTVTAANASGINDGAAAVVLMTAAGGEAPRRAGAGGASRAGRRPASTRASWASARSPRRRRRSPRPAGPSPTSTLIEANEAFAAQALAPSARSSASTRPRSTSTAARSPSATRSARAAPASLLRSSTRWRGATRRRASRRYASAAAWASRCVSSGTERGAALAEERPSRSSAKARLAQSPAGGAAGPSPAEAVRRALALPVPLRRTATPHRLAPEPAGRPPAAPPQKGDGRPPCRRGGPCSR